MNRTVRLVVTGLFGLFLVGVPRPGSAAEREDFDELIHRGVELRRQGNDAKAEEVLRRAYGMAQTPRAAAQLGLVEFALGKYGDAERHLSEALASHEPWIEGHRELLEKSRTEIRQRLVAVEVVGAAPDAAVALGDGRSIPLPPDHVLWLAPGAVSLRIEAPGRESITKSVETKPGEHVVIDVSSRKEAPAAPPQPTAVHANPVVTELPATNTDEPSRGSAMRAWGVGIGAVGVASLVAGVVTYHIGGTKLGHIESKTYHSSDLNWQTYDRAGVALMIGGGVALAAGTTLFLLGRRETTTSLALVPTSDGAFATVGGAF
jgi:hypothetical protein